MIRAALEYRLRVQAFFLKERQIFYGHDIFPRISSVE